MTHLTDLPIRLSYRTGQDDLVRDLFNPCLERRDRWQGVLEEDYQRLAVGLSRVHAVVATNATFLSESFQVRLRARVNSRAVHHLLVADEVHNLGLATSYSMAHAKLQEDFFCRLMVDFLVADND